MCSRSNREVAQRSEGVEGEAVKEAAGLGMGNHDLVSDRVDYEQIMRLAYIMPAETLQDG